MNKVRRIPLAMAAAVVLVVAGAGAAGAGIAAPRDMVATPATGTVGQTVVITNAANSPCGGQQGDGPAQAELTVLKPDGATELNVTVPADASGDWTYSYTTTDQVGTYKVAGFCADVPNGTVDSAATDFSYSDTTFDITEADTTTEPAPVTPTSTPPSPLPDAVGGTPVFTG